MTMKCNLLYALSLVTAVVEQLCFSGLIFGWSSISFVLKSEGFFSSCYEVESENQTMNSSNISASTDSALSTAYSTDYSSCSKSQDESINLVFTIASMLLSFSTLPNGFIFDRFGTWAARVIAILLVTGGAVLVSISTIATSFLLYPAMCGFSIGGILLLVTNTPIGNLFGSARSSVITLLSGALDSSSVIFLLVKIVYESGTGISYIFQFIAWCTAFLWIRTFFLMPRMHIPFPLPRGFQYGFYDCKANKTPKDSLRLKSKEDPLVEETTTEVHTKSCYSCVKTVMFWTNLMHFGLLQLRNYFFLGTFYTWMQHLLPPGSAELSGYVNVFGVCQFFGVFFAPLNGLLIDGAIKRLRRNCKIMPIVFSKGTAFSAFATTTFGVLFSLTLLIPSVKLQYVSYILQVLFRSFLYGGNATFLSLMFPPEHFGKLYGITMTVAGLMVLLQFPLFSLVLRVFNEDFLVMNLIFLFVCLLTFIHPVTLYINSKKIQLQANNDSSELNRSELLKTSVNEDERIEL